MFLQLIFPLLQMQQLQQQEHHFSPVQFSHFPIFHSIFIIYFNQTRHRKMVESLLLVRSGSGTKSRGNIEYFHLKLALATIPKLIGLLCIGNLLATPLFLAPNPHLLLVLVLQSNSIFLSFHLLVPHSQLTSNLPNHCNFVISLVSS